MMLRSGYCACAGAAKAATDSATAPTKQMDLLSILSSPRVPPQDWNKLTRCPGKGEVGCGCTKTVSEKTKCAQCPLCVIGGHGHRSMSEGATVEDSTASLIDSRLAVANKPGSRDSR